MNNDNILEFLNKVSDLTGQIIGPENIHPMDTGRFYYTQAPKEGAPMLMHHYRGPFFIDINPKDYAKIAEGKISPDEYIKAANWQVGYFWGGGGMIGGGYYQPLDIIGRANEVRRYLKILSCRGVKLSIGYTPTEEVCMNCTVGNCPFSKYKEGNWEEELDEQDPRVDLFEAISRRFTLENPGNILRTFYCGDTIPEDEVWFSPFGRYDETENFAFSASVSSSVIQALLMRELKPENFDTYVKSLRFRARQVFGTETFEVNGETLKSAYEGMDFTKKKPIAAQTMMRTSKKRSFLSKIFRG